MKRVALFLFTNLAILVVLGIVVNILGLNRFITEAGLNLPTLFMFAAVFGMGGSFISLAMSKWIAKRATGAQVIEKPRNQTELWLVETVRAQASQAGIGMPEVAIWDSPAPNAFATGANRNNALVAVSTGLLRHMNKDEIEAVLGHEISHVANGDMVTLALIQGVVNTFVVFLSRVVGFFVDKVIFRTERGIGPGFFIASLVAQVVLGILASMIVAWFSRQREFRADRGSANLLGSPRPMINALARLGGVPAGELPQAFEAHGIKKSQSRFLGLFASHPPIEQRIAALQAPEYAR